MKQERFDTKNGLYHREVMWMPFFDETIERMVSRRRKVVLSKHLQESPRDTVAEFIKNQEDILNALECALQSEEEKVEGTFEVEYKDGFIVKFAVKAYFNQDFSVSMVFYPKKDFLILGTLWLTKWDEEKTEVDKTRYIKEG